MKLEDYKKAKSLIINSLLNHNPISIYEYGSYNYPGLSDIDLFVVLNNRKQKNLHKTLVALKSNSYLKNLYLTQQLWLFQKKF